MRFVKARALLAESEAAGITLKVTDGELRYATRDAILSSELKSRLQLLKADLIAELSRPRFPIAHRPADGVQLPNYTLGWWSELCINQLLANMTHVVWRLRGDRCASRFQTALEAAAARHDLLTAKFILGDGALQLRFGNRSAVVAAPLEEHQDPVRSIEHVVWAPFEPGQVFRPFLLQISPTEIICGFVLHHFVIDFQGCRILARELYDEMYGITGAVSRTGDPPLQYSDYIHGLADWLAGAPVRYRLDYWREQMSGAPPVCLPDAVEAGAVSTGPLKTVNFRILPTLRARLLESAKSCESTLALLLLAAKFVALSRCLRQNDLVVTTLVSGRDDIALLKLVGNTTDCVPIRLCVRSEVSFATLLEELHACYVLACRYRVQWGVILETLKAAGASTIAPTFNFISIAGFESARIGPTPASNLSLEPLSLEIPQEIGSAAWHASHQMNLFDNGQYIECHVKYMSLKHPRGTIQTFAECFTTCLEQIARAPRSLIGRLATPP